VSNKPRAKRKFSAKLMRGKLANAYVKYMGVSFLPESNCSLIDLDKYNVLTKKTANTVEFLTGHRYNWQMLLIVFCRDNNGLEYFKTAEIESSRKCFSHEIHDSTTIAHELLVSEQNRQHVVSIGWLASPRAREWDYDLTGDLFTGLGAWNYLAKHEQQDI